MGDYEQGLPEQPNPDEEKRFAEEAELAGWTEFAQDTNPNPNLVPFFLSKGDVGKKWLGSTLAKKVCDDTNQGWDDSSEYREKRRENHRLFTGFLKKKTFPFDGCANVHIPVMLERILRLTANVYAEIFTDKDLVFGVKPTGPNDYEAAEVLTIHGNWQLRNQLTDFLTQMDKAITLFFLDGSVFCYSWYDKVRRRNRHDILTCEDFVIPFTWETNLIDIADIPWKTRIVRKYPHEVEQMKGEWEQVAKVLSKPPPPWDFMEGKNRQQAADQEGVQPSDGAAAKSGTTGSSSAYIFFEYYGWMKMPGETTHRPICATVSADHKTVVKLFIREEEDWQDRMRFDRQMAELGQYQADVAQFPQQMAAFMALPRDPVSGQPLPGVDPATGQPTPPPEPPVEPPPPQWATANESGEIAPEPIRMVPIEMFSHGRCAYNPSGMLGLSYGDILAAFNASTNEALNRFYDAATFNNIWSLLVAGDIDLGSSNIPMVPGKVIKVKGVIGDSLEKAIKELKPGAPSPDLFNLVRFFGEAADAAVAAPGVLSGEPGKSGETFRGIATRIEKATKQLSSAGIKFLQFLDQILKNNARLNAAFLSDEEIVQVNDDFAENRKFTVNPDGTLAQSITVSRDLYRRNYDVSFTADVRFSSQAQKIAEADEVLAMIMQTPLVQNQALLYAAIANCLRARGKQEMIPLLGKPPPVMPTPLGLPPPAPPPGPPGPGGAPPAAGPSPTTPPPPGAPIQGPQPEAQAA